MPVSRPLCTALESRVKTEGVRGRGSALYSNHSMQAQACWVCLTNIIIMYLVPTPCVLINPRFPKTMPSIRQNRPDKIGVIDLTGTCINSLQQLIHLLIAHLLAQIRQDVPQLSHSNKTSHVLVEDLKTSAVFFWFAWVAETAGSVEDLAE